MYLIMWINVKVENGLCKCDFFNFYLLVVNISADNVLYGLNYFKLVSNIRVQGTVSQTFVLGLSSYFMLKKRVTFYIFF